VIPVRKRHRTHNKHSNSDRAILQVERVGDPVVVRDDPKEEDRERRVERDLEDRVDDHYDGAEVDVPSGDLVPDHDHCDAPGEADHDDPGAVRGEVGERGVRAGEHDLVGSEHGSGSSGGSSAVRAKDLVTGEQWSEEAPERMGLDVEVGKYTGSRRGCRRDQGMLGS
jgi:hypothetical protein